MSKHASFSRHAKRVTDEATSAVYAELGHDAESTETFTELLHVTRTRSSFLTHPSIRDRRHVQVATLKHLSRFAGRYVRSPASWSRCAGSFFEVTASLSEHLLSHYPMPRFLSSVWRDGEGEHADAKRRWYVEHAAGTRFRDLSLPMPITRRMEDVFLHSPDHLSVEQAMRRAEIIALGGSEQLVGAVLSTPAGNTLEHGGFWRSCMAFFVRFAGEVDLAMVGPIVDFVESIRHRSVEVHTDAGIMLQAPPEPDFSLKGRTPTSVLRLVDRWHKRLGVDTAPSLTWTRSRYSGLCIGERPVEPDAPAAFWQLVELTDSAQLRREGAALHHCVASYAHLCLMGRSRIWSLRRVVGDNVRSVLTLEIDPRSGSIVQARGLRNRPASGRPLALMQQWAAAQNLRLAL